MCNKANTIHFYKFKYAKTNTLSPKTQIHNASKYIYGILHLSHNLIYYFFLQLYSCKIFNYTFFFLLDFCIKNITLCKELAHTGKITETLKRTNTEAVEKPYIG